MSLLKSLKTFAFGIILSVSASVGHTATVGIGESVDFSFDVSGFGNILLGGYAASCAEGLGCFRNGLTLIVPGGSIGYQVGTTRGAFDILDTTLSTPNPSSDAISIGSSLNPRANIAAALDTLFVRVTALSGTMTVGVANLSFVDTPNFTLFGTELAPAPVPLPASGLMLLTAVGAGGLAIRRRTATLTKELT